MTNSQKLKSDYEPQGIVMLDDEPPHTQVLKDMLRGLVFTLAGVVIGLVIAPAIYSFL